MTPAQATQELVAVNDQLRTAIDALPIIANTYDRKRSQTFKDLIAAGESTTSAREWATTHCLDESFDQARAKALVESLRERQALLVFLLEHDLLS